MATPDTTAQSHGVIPGADVDIRDAQTIEDLIPPELRALAKDDDEPAEEPGGDDDAPEKDVESVPPVVEDEEPEPDKEELPEDEEDADVTPEDIEKLLSGKKDDEDEAPEEKAFWAESEDYKELRKTLENIGVDTAGLDKILQHVADKTQIDQSKIIQGLKEDADKSRGSVEQVRGELDRLRQIERAVRFDSSEEVRTKYGVPLQEAAQKIADVLNREGVGVTLQQVLTAKNRSEMASLFDDANLTDKDMATIANQWRTYKEVDTAYRTEKESVQKDLTRALGTTIAPETVDATLKNALGTMLKRDPRFSYVREALDEGLDNHEDVMEMLELASSNFRSFVGALSDPSARLHSEEYLGKLAGFMFDSAHGRLMSARHTELQAEYDKLKKASSKLAKNYRELVESAKGITGAKGPARGNGKHSAPDEDEKEAAETYQKLLKDDRALDELLGL